jgi:hypothetical protein
VHGGQVFGMQTRCGHSALLQPQALLVQAASLPQGAPAMPVQPPLPSQAVAPQLFSSSSLPLWMAPSQIPSPLASKRQSLPRPSVTLLIGANAADSQKGAAPLAGAQVLFPDYAESILVLKVLVKSIFETTVFFPR